MKKIDAHAHIGYIGGWANVGINEEELIRQMDEFEIEKTALCCEDNRITVDVMNAHPDRIIGCIYVNPLNPATVDSMEEYAAKDSRVKIIQHDRNYGRVKARNTTINAASGSYLVFCDDDDELLPGFLQSAYQ